MRKIPNPFNQKALWGVLIGITLIVICSVIVWVYVQDLHRIECHVTFYGINEPLEVISSARTVGDALKEQGIMLKPQDVVVPPESTPLWDGMEIDLGIVERKVREVKKIVPYDTHADYTDTMNVGEIIDVDLGKDGLADQQIESFFLNGQEAFEKVVKSTILVPVKNAKVIEGTALRQKLYPLKKRARVKKIITLEATAYYPGPEDTWPYASGTTASGLKAGYGVVAVDPRVIKLKTLLYVEGYGFAIAADKGGAIKGKKIDLCFDTYEQAVQFGRKKVQVYLLR
ncbi:MAG TPA: 3D domain-containing protein [bacterium]|nr:3D domain-containing protein [bacterium]